ncbi:orphan sodium- and chloride-dependent neurotransmitter transporter NTT5-like [Orycteropus afer afer]|uniref:Orphan sodium- and chloride-dependent neurotransmitter transporter NTT5-like n=1 Tax=Orycteropus afer afer TaxID=1230840 RepID=A0A8B6ZZT4_ORYAF|nr:orphan sodium- and chloride-dependent neurotransmitter transporter NTT5-like [Orycteropus afer afer]
MIPSMYYFYWKILKASDTIEDAGPVIPSMSLSLFLTWCVTAVITISGLKSAGKISFVESLFIVVQAGDFILSSLGLGFGVIASFSSYMSASNDCLSDAFIVALINLGPSLLATSVIFSVVSQGLRFSYLAFIEAVSLIPGSAFWAILLFMIQTSDLDPKPMFSPVSISLLMFLLSLFFARPSGFYFVTLLGAYWLLFSVLLLIILETVVVSWVYGAKRALEGPTRDRHGGNTESRGPGYEVRHHPLAGQGAEQKVSAQNVQMTEKQSEDVTRPVWSNKYEYILAQVGYSVRLLNLWKLSHLWLVYGGVYIILYIFMTFFIGIPLLFLEMAFGQRLRQGSLDVWKFTSPWMTGLGYTSFMVCIIEGLCRSIINCWIFFYFGQAFQFPLPWDKCPLVKNSSEFDAECARTTPSMYFWYRKTLKASDTVEDGGPVIPSISLSLFLTWCFILLIMINGLKSVGKAMYVLVAMPFLITLSFLFWIPLLEDLPFIQHLLVFKAPSVYSLRVWFQAGRHALSAVGLGFGVIAAFSSHMPPSNNCLMDAFVVVLVNLIISLFVMPSILSIMNLWATVTTNRCTEKNVEILLNLVSSGELPPEAKPPENMLANARSTFDTWIDSLPYSTKKVVLSKVSTCNIKDKLLKVKQGSTFAFLAFTEAMSFIPGSALRSILFLMMLLSIGLSGTVGIMQAIITPLQDTFPFFRRHPKLLIVSVSLLMFLLSLFFARPSGYYYFRLLSHHWVVHPVIVITLETVAIAWFYGSKRFLAEMMTLMGHPISPIFHYLWCYVCPLVLLGLTLVTLFYIFTKDFTYMAWNSSISKEVLKEYPVWTLKLATILSIIAFLPVPLYCVYCLIHKVPFRCFTFNMPSTVSKSLILRSRLRVPRRDFHKEDIWQDEKRNG